MCFGRQMCRVCVCCVVWGVVSHVVYVHARARACAFARSAGVIVFALVCFRFIS